MLPNDVVDVRQPTQTPYPIIFSPYTTPSNPQAPDDLNRIRQEAAVSKPQTTLPKPPTINRVQNDGIPFNADRQLTLPPPPSSSGLILPLPQPVAPTSSASHQIKLDWQEQQILQAMQALYPELFPPYPYKREDWNKKSQETRRREIYIWLAQNYPAEYSSGAIPYGFMPKLRRVEKLFTNKVTFKQKKPSSTATRPTTPPTPLLPSAPSSTTVLPAAPSSSSTYDDSSDSSDSDSTEAIEKSKAHTSNISSSTLLPSSTATIEKPKNKNQSVAQVEQRQGAALPFTPAVADEALPNPVVAIGGRKPDPANKLTSDQKFSLNINQDDPPDPLTFDHQRRQRLTMYRHWMRNPKVGFLTPNDHSENSKAIFGYSGNRPRIQRNKTEFGTKEWMHYQKGWATRKWREYKRRHPQAAGNIRWHWNEDQGVLQGAAPPRAQAAQANNNQPAPQASAPHPKTKGKRRSVLRVLAKPKPKYSNQPLYPVGTPLLPPVSDDPPSPPPSPITPPPSPISSPRLQPKPKAKPKPKSDRGVRELRGLLD